ncbi:SUKH-3 domain-containing protein [Listeria costaricensis]|uniref:SUKH-3 domain-containing protein n=1 Tax=Listeria costaricensis TaxID=2026604 RepID=UPI000C079A97|nr:SUKH-3 domain-containing protein [Listeria costaricensis]
MRIADQSRDQQLRTLLSICGYQPERQFHPHGFKEFAAQNGFPWSAACRIFVKAYANLPHTCIYLGDVADGCAKYDFTMDISVKAAKLEQATPDFQKMCAHCEEELLPVGTFGYYYPGILALDGAGKLYLYHDYDERVVQYDTLHEALDGELQKNTLGFISRVQFSVID